MSVNKEQSGRRSIEVEVEVPGTPQQVWQAIATGPGISSWFLPVEVQERVGGAIICRMGPGIESLGTVTAWDPPHRISAEGQNWGPGAPPQVTEWIVEARSPGTCVVRVVHSLFAAADDWDDQLESLEAGWPRFFGILQLYLSHFQGRGCSAIHLMGSAAGPETTVWDELRRDLGLAGVAEGQRWKSPDSGVPPLAGTAERICARPNHYAILRLDHPGPGLASPGVFTMHGQVHLSISFYFYGNDGSAIIKRDEPRWRAWMAERFPSVENPSEVP